MKSAASKLGTALAAYKKISLLSKIMYLADWDMQTNMPPNGSKGRSEQIAYLTEIIVDQWLDPGFRDLIKQLENDKLNPAGQALVRNLVQAGKLYFKVPKKILVERARITSEAVGLWQEARRKKDFAIFRPYLQKIIALHREIPEYLGYSATPYDALLDLYEPGLTSDYVDQIFEQLKRPLSVLHQSLYERSRQYKFKKFTFPKNKQRELADFIMTLMNYDLDSGRLDESPHPFCTTLDRHDTRITTRYHLDDMRISFQSVMHESGHALYEQGINKTYDNTPLEMAASMGIHESQSRFWENQIGRHPLFLQFLHPRLVKLFPDYFKSMKAEDFGIYFNHIKRIPIRTDSDEVAYNLHIILRFDMEREIITKKTKIDDLPDLWNERSRNLLHINPANDSVGILQDIHWSYGNFGYFPTYALGNLYAAQFFNKLRYELAIDKFLSNGNLRPILSWLRKNIHIYGGYYLPQELIRKVTGESLNPKYFLEYVNTKYKSLYKI